MTWTAAAITAAVTIVAAAAGNLLIPKGAVAWFRALDSPRWLVPYPVFIAVGRTYPPGPSPYGNATVTAPQPDIDELSTAAEAGSED